MSVPRAADKVLSNELSIVATTGRVAPRMVFAAAALLAAIGALTGDPAFSRIAITSPSFSLPADRLDIPEPLRAAGTDLAVTLTSIVWLDIDADGDIDVAATDASLNILLWVNDGAGHLTRQRPAPPRAGWADCDAPTVGARHPLPRIGLQPHAPTSSELTVVRRDSRRHRIFFAFDGYATSFAKGGTLRGPPLPRPVA